MFLKTKILREEWIVLSVGEINQRAIVCSNWEYLTLLSTKEHFQKIILHIIKEELLFTLK